MKVESCNDTEQYKPETLQSFRRAAIQDVIDENSEKDDDEIVNAIKGYLISHNVKYSAVVKSGKEFILYLKGTEYHYKKGFVNNLHK